MVFILAETTVHNGGTNGTAGGTLHQPVFGFSDSISFRPATYIGHRRTPVEYPQSRFTYLISPVEFQLVWPPREHHYKSAVAGLPKLFILWNQRGQCKYSYYSCWQATCSPHVHVRVASLLERRRADGARHLHNHACGCGGISVHGVMCT